ncbi:FAD-linked oxidase C-terminal domain-containing protein [Sinorhizobium meliloti]|uniref:FAD-linked oxidase C-terminal domain-containing protein n=1 Tax=Rhizobium meliloti TaxID=382 RepID=UPI000FD3161C|nr:FAD-linked oxidase C-terminal domain-containing protein [Sinorhizobium meliloti]MQV33085.1 FAD-binding protein [Sinorhizobium meliloti]RVE79400.1 FAD-binding protein [Sinorhizobium meliloti]RVG43829.1 FAD-binding protein [Sinorhizobium meliloti]RVM04391.1 FAD-binding protein [Sinorhizobium meliloti]RVM43404.1 FAD-binding protein [Sinorhizobium meliloti]
MPTIVMPDPDAGVIARAPQIIAALEAALPAGTVISSPEETRAYECDALTAYRCPPLAVVLPRTTEEVATAMRVCHELRVPVVPRGAGTSLAGGALPTADSVIIGTMRLGEILEVDTANRFIRVQTGITNLAVSAELEAEGFFYAPDPSSQLACTIAGNIAMNSGGAHCLKYGVTTNNLMGVRIVMATGEIIELGGPLLGMSGLDLIGLICGSEGQLAIVTEATLRIVPKPEGARPVLIGFDSAETAGECVGRIIRSGLLPVAIEYMDDVCLRAVEAFVKAGYPSCAAVLIVEVEGSEAEIDHQVERIRLIAEELNPVEFRASRTAEESLAIWKGRKSAFGAMGRLGDYLCLDGTVPVSKLPHTLKRIGELSKAYGLEVANVFHAGDGNMHPLILFNANAPGELERAEEFGADILRLCVDVGGCLTGEHGVGIEKRDLMTKQYTADDLAIQMEIKSVFDPTWLLNPAKVFPLEASQPHRDAAARCHDIH